MTRNSKAGRVPHGGLRLDALEPRVLLSTGVPDDGALVRAEVPGDTLAAALVTAHDGSDKTTTHSYRIGDGSYGARDVDIYRLSLNDVSDRVTVDIDAEVLGSGLDSVVEILDPSGAQQAANDDSGGLDSYLVWAPQDDGLGPGTYYVVVRGYGNSGYDPNVPGSGPGGSVGTYSLTLTVDDQATGLPPDAYEPNNSFAAPAALGTLSGSQTFPNLSIHSASDEDYFRFTLGAPGGASHSAAIDFSHANGDLDLYLYDAQQNEVGRSTGTTNHEQVSLNGLGAGNYFARVRGFSGATNPSYTLAITAPAGGGGIAADAYEPNNDFAAASDLGALSGATTLDNLTIHAGGNDDYFRFTTGVAGGSADSVAIDFTHAEGDLDLYLYDIAHNELGSSLSVTNHEEVSLNGLAAGTYFVRIHGYAGDTSPGYTLTISAPLTTIDPDPWETQEPIALTQNKAMDLTIHDPAESGGLGTRSDSFTFTTVATGGANHYLQFRAAPLHTYQLDLYDGGANLIDSVTYTNSNDAPLVYYLQGLAPDTYTAVFDDLTGETPYRMTISAPFTDATLPAWTILVYVNGDNDLEGAALEDVNEMEAVARTPDLQVAIILDRASGYATTTPDWTDARVGIVQSDSNPNLISTPLTSWGERNMGDPQTLEDFINWGVATLPAEHYAVVLWDHGSGLYGSMMDTRSSYDMLTTEELAIALEGVPTHIDVLGFDACLMASSEIMYQVRNEVSYFVASEETEGWDGWDYTDLFRDLLAAPGLSPQQFAQVIVNSSSDDADITTLSAADATGPELAAAVAGFVNAVVATATSADWSAIEAARDASAGFTYPEFRDLGSFMAEIVGGVPGAPIVNAANAVLDALAAKVVANFSLPAAGGTGLTIHLPDVGERVMAGYSALDFAAATGWDEFLAALTDRTARPQAVRDWAEPNDLRSTAYDLHTLSGPGNRYSALSIHNAADVDWFRFDLPLDGEAGSRVSIAFSNAAGNLDLYLYDAQGTFLASSVTTLNTESVSLQGRPAGTYFARIAGQVNPSYTLGIDAPGSQPDWLEDNNTRDKASPVPLNSRVVGLNIQPGDEDWFSFSPSKLPGVPVSARVEFSPPGNLTIELYDDAGNLLATDTGNSGTLSVSYPSGIHPVYYVRVLGQQGAFIPYSLDVREGQGAAPVYPLIATQVLPGGARVSFYDADPGDAAPYPIIAWSTKDLAYRTRTADILVRAGSGPAVSSITLLDGVGSLEDIGIVVEGPGASLGSLADSRRSPDEAIAFLVASSGLRSVALRSGFAGANLNGFTTPGGWNLGNDIDGDGATNDPAALLAGGGLGTFTALGDVDGDLFADGPVNRATITGGDLNGDLASNNGGISRLTVAAQLNRLTQTYAGGTIRGNVRSAGDIAQLTVTGGHVLGAVVSGGSIAKLTTRALLEPASQTWRGGSVAGGITAAWDLGTLTLTGGDLTGNVTVGGSTRSIYVRALFNTAAGWTGGNVADNRIEVGWALDSLRTDRDFTDSFVEADLIGSVSVSGLISGTGGDDEIHARDPWSEFSVADLTGSAWINSFFPADFSGVTAWVG